jgi:pimeloyl-ACP methyl ester carboxylesterase
MVSLTQQTLRLEGSMHRTISSESSRTAAPPRVAPQTRRGRRFLVWLGGIAAVLLGLSLLGALYESAAERADARANPPPGQMVDVGGHRLHINCAGTGSPTVVIEAGLGDWSAAWSSWVQPEAAKTTRVCTYDRAGYGHSEPGPLPRTAAQFAQELHTALQGGQIPGPYVLVGHSAGGLSVRVFAHDYPADVAGVVLIDSMSPGDAGATPSQMTLPSGIGWVLTLPARIGALRLLTGPLHLKPHVAPEVAESYDAFSVTPQFLQAYLDEFMGVPVSQAQAGVVTSFGALPLIVLSRGLDQDPEWMEGQTDLLQLSSTSEQLIAATSGHNIEYDQPDAAVGAIVKMVEQIRRQ